MDGHQDLGAARGQPRLLDQIRGVIRRLTTASAPSKPTSIGTDGTSCSIGRGIRRRGVRPTEAFLTHLAVQGKVAASTQNQALNGIVFLYRQVLKKNWAG